MKKLSLIVLLFICKCGWTQEAEMEIRQNMQQQQNDWNRGDLPAFMRFYWKNDSLKFISKRGITYGWETVLNNYQRSYPDKEQMGELKFTLSEVQQLSPDAVYVIGQWELKKEKAAGGYFTLLWRKLEKEGWVIVSDHTS